MYREAKYIKEGRSLFLNGNEYIDVLLKLKLDELLIQKREYPKRFSTSAQFSNKIRKVVVYRNETGGLGLTIKGGAEHGLPILISKILNKDLDNNLQHSESEDSLFVGDAILEINGEDVQSLNHKQVVSLLKCGGDRVELKVKFYKPAFHYLTLQKESMPRPSLLEGEENFTGSVMYEKRWTTFMKISLAGNYLTKKCSNNDESMPENSLLIGDDKVKLKFEDFETFQGWMKILRNRVNAATKHLIHQFNINLPNKDQIAYMAWVKERSGNGTTLPTNIIIRGDSIFLSHRMPIKVNEENEDDISYKVYECLMIKKNKKCVALKNFDSPTKHYMFDSNFDFKEFLKAWYTSNYLAIFQLKRKNFEISRDENPSYLQLDFDSSTISLINPNTQTILWTYKLSQIKKYNLKSNFRISFDMWNQSRTGHEQKVLDCVDAIAVLSYLNSFINAKLASLDPVFLLHL